VTDEDVLRRSIEERRGELDPLLSICLSAAVPLWIEKVRRWDPTVRESRAHEAGHVIAYGAGAAAVATGGKERNKKTAKKKRPNQGAAEVFQRHGHGVGNPSLLSGRGDVCGQPLGGHRWMTPSPRRSPTRASICIANWTAIATG
jgi:hypothetical protein